MVGLPLGYDPSGDQSYRTVYAPDGDLFSSLHDFVYMGATMSPMYDKVITVTVGYGAAPTTEPQVIMDRRTKDLTHVSDPEVGAVFELMTGGRIRPAAPTSSWRSSRPGDPGRRRFVPSVPDKQALFAGSTGGHLHPADAARPVR